MNKVTVQNRLPLSGSCPDQKHKQRGALSQSRSTPLPVQQGAQGGDSTVPLRCQHQAQPILQQGALQEKEEQSFGAALPLDESLSLADG